MLERASAGADRPPSAISRAFAIILFAALLASIVALNAF
jgi:hypothetical protein